MSPLYCGSHPYFFGCKMSQEEEEYIQRAATYWRVDPVTGKPVPPEDDIIEDEEPLDDDADTNTDGLESELTVPLTVTVLVYFG